jgi:sugar transferase (PEP-CTERM/EpsH1 system associated)
MREGPQPHNSLPVKPALVYLCQRIPYPLVKGERVTSFNLLRHLSRSYRVFLGTFIDDRADTEGIPFLRRMLEEVCIEEAFPPWALIRAFPRWLRGEPLSFAVFRSSALSRWLDEVEAKHKPVAIVTHSSNISAYAVDKFHRAADEEPRRILHFADVDSEKFAAYAARARGVRKWIYSVESRRVRREEMRLAACANVVSFVSDQETQLFRTILAGRPARVETIPNGVDTELFDPDRDRCALDPEDQATFVFTGVMDYPPNVEAVKWFAARVLPEVRSQIADARFMIVGARPTAAVQALSRTPGVQVTGRVESVTPYLARAHVAVAPLQVARGVQNKVLEAMAMAKPVIVTPAVAAGISAARPEEHLITAGSPEQWTAACIRLMRERGTREALGAAARALVLKHYGWPAQFAKLDLLLAT